MNTPPKPWTTLNETLHADCKIFNVYKRHCIHSPDKREGDFFVIKSANWALSIPLTPDNQIVMVRQYRFSIDDLCWEVPGGVLQTNESPITAATRELKEETGFIGENPQIIGSAFPNPAIMNNQISFVLIHNCIQKSITNWDHHEELEVKIFPIDTVFSMAYNGAIKHAMVLNALFFLKSYLEKSMPI